ncbi:MAG: DNA polymerase III subunit delta, partial [Planctomycetota bacterium]
PRYDDAVKHVALVLGEDRFLSRLAAEGLLAARPDLETTRLRGSEADLAAVLDEARTPTLLGGRRAVVVEDAEPLLQGDALRALAEYAGRPASGSLLLLLAAKLDRRFSAAGELEKAATVLACEPLRGAAASGWIQTRAREAHGLQAARDAVEALRACVGDDAGLLDAALGRLKEQIAPRARLLLDDVLSSTEEHRAPIVFEPGNALEAGDLKAALRAVAACFAEGVRVKEGTVTDEKAVALILLARLHASYARLLRFHQLRRTGMEEDEAAQRAGVPPKGRRPFLANARRHPAERLAARHALFLEADAGLKGDGHSASQALEGLLVGLLR